MKLYSVSYCYYGEKIVGFFKELIAANIFEDAVISVFSANIDHPVFKLCVEVKSYNEATIKQVIKIFEKFGITEKQGLAINGDDLNGEKKVGNNGAV